MCTKLDFAVFWKKILLLITMAFSGTCLFFSEDNAVVMHIFSLLLIVAVSIGLIGLEVYHPFFLFSLCFFLYSAAYPVLLLLGEVKDYGYSRDTLEFEMLGLCVFLLIIPFNKVKYKDLCSSYVNQYISIRYFDILLTIMNAFILLGEVAIVLGGYEGKKDIYSNGGILLNIIFKLAYFSIVFFTYSLYFKLKNNIQIDLKWFLFCELVIIVLGLISGERDYMFHIFIVTVICYSIVGRINIYQYIGLGLVGVVILPISALYKYYILRGSHKSFNINRILIEFLNGEFKSAGKNLQVLVSDGKYNYFRGKGMLNEFLRIFFDTGFSHGKWFNSLYFSDRAAGQGFTLVGDGYLNGGWIGIIVVFAIVAGILSILYKNAIRSDYYMTIYIYMIPLFVYSIRQDLANILSPLIKYAVLGTLVIAVFNEINSKNVLGESANRSINT